MTSKLFPIVAALSLTATPIVANANLVPTTPALWGWNLKGGQSGIVYRLEAIENYSKNGRLNTTLRVRYGNEIYPVRINTVGNECGRLPSGSNGSSLNVCVDQRKYIVKPVWEKPGYETSFKGLKCNLPILLNGNKIGLKTLCRRSVPTM